MNTRQGRIQLWLTPLPIFLLDSLPVNWAEFYNRSVTEKTHDCSNQAHRHPQKSFLATCTQKSTTARVYKCTRSAIFDVLDHDQVDLALYQTSLGTKMRHCGTGQILQSCTINTMLWYAKQCVYDSKCILVQNKIVFQKLSELYNTMTLILLSVVHQTTPRVPRLPPTVTALSLPHSYDRLFAQSHSRW